MNNWINNYNYMEDSENKQSNASKALAKFKNSIFSVMI